jgi:hypothetical protein
MSRRWDRVKRLEATVGTDQAPTYRVEVRPGVFLTTAPYPPVPDCYACRVYSGLSGGDLAQGQGAVIGPDGVARVLTSMAGISRVVQPCPVHQGTS